MVRHRSHFQRKLLQSAWPTWTCTFFVGLPNRHKTPEEEEELEPVVKSAWENLQVFYEISDRTGLMTEFRPRKFTQHW